MKILTIIGACPQFIKAAALSREIAKYEDIQEMIVKKLLIENEKMIICIY